MGKPTDKITVTLTRRQMEALEDVVQFAAQGDVTPSRGRMLDAIADAISRAMMPPRVRIRGRLRELERKP